MLINRLIFKTMHCFNTRQFSWITAHLFVTLLAVGLTSNLHSQDTTAFLTSSTTSICLGDTATLNAGTVGADYGDGSDGALTVSSGTSYTDAVRTGVTGTNAAGENTLTVASSSGFAVGDEIIIITMVDANTSVNTTGKHEFNIITAISGNTLTLAAIRAFAFNASSTQIHQAIKVPNYTNVSISSGATLTCAAWDGSTGGVLCFRANGTLTNSGTITAVGKGYRGVGHTALWRNKDGAQGEGIYGTGYAGGNSSGSNNVTWNGANGNGGGGGTGRQDSGGGAGGGYASNGTNGNNSGGHFGGTGGLSVGTANLDLLIMGGAGGEGGGDEDGALAGSGGNGGGIIYISASITQNAGTITCNGNNGGNGTNSGGGGGCGMGGGGGGAGGSIKLISVFDGTGTITSIGGNGGTNNGCGGAGGAGSVGRIALASTISSYPTTNPISATASLAVITGSSFAWSNGDTSSFIQVSPATTTTYTVTITNGTWADTLSNEIYVFGVPNMPTALADIEHCAGTFTFNATTDSLVQTVWYDSPTGGTPIFYGNEFTTPFLNDTTTYYFRSQYVTYTPPADAVDNSMQLALGLRLLVSDYEGKAVILRKSATANDTASFGFNFLGQLDADAINAWAGSATDLWVHTIFDQSGNGRNLLNTTTGQQPKLILSGENGKPVLRFVTGTFLRYTTNDIVYPMSIVTAAKLTSNSCGRVFGAANNYLYAFYSNQVNWHHFNTWISSSGTNMVPASSSDTWIHSSMSASNTSHRFFDNGDEWPANTINNANSQPPNGFQLNGYAANNETSNVDIMEVFIFNDVITDTEREYIEGRIASQYDWQTAGGQVVDAAAPCLLSNPNIDSVRAIVTAPSFGISLDTITANCGADSILIDAGSGWQTYSWSNLDTTQICTARYSGKYKIVVNDGSCDVTDSVFVSLPKPVLDDFTICNGDTITAGYLNLGGFASGGILDTIGQEAVHKFLTDGTLVFPSTTQVRALIVGGGGGGGMDIGGGGGAGGFIDTTFILPAGSYNISVGQGGTGAPAAGTFGQPTGHQYSIPALNGGNSSIGSLLTAIGGGAGGTSYWNSTPGAAGSNGGSGGGCSGYNAPNGSGAGLETAGQGNRGGHGGGSHYSGGGGGAGSQGGGGPNGGTYNANGGSGLQSDILGTTYYFAGGGGGSGFSVVGGNGGIGGGGGGAVGFTTGGAGLNNGSPGGGGNTGQQTNKPGGNAGANTGGGGGGGSHFNSNNKGGEGGSGIVVIRYTPILSYQFLWSTGDTTATINVSPTQTTDYYVTITDGVSICYDTMTVFVNAPVYSFSSDTITYCGVDTATLDAGTGWSNYAWSTGDSTQLLTTTTGGVYHLTVTNQYGCTVSDSVSVGVINTIVTEGDTTVCLGETATLTVSPNGGVSTEHALAFDGNGDFVISPYDASFNVSNITIEAWVYSSNFSQNGFIFEKGAVNTQYSLFFEGGTLKFRNGGATFAINSASIGFTNNAWHHVAATYDGAQKKIYVDGALAGTQNYTGTFATNTQGTIIGAYGAAGANSYFFNGKIDEVRVWNLARTATEIAESYNTTLPPNSTGLIGYWPMEEGSGNVIENLVTQTNSNAFAGNTAFVSSDAPISGSNSLSYSWSNGDTTNTIDVSPNSTTTYYVTITDGFAECYDSITVTVVNPNFTFINDTILSCGTDTVNVSAGSTWDNYLWSNGDTTETTSITSSGVYTLTVSNNGQCETWDTVTVSVINPNNGSNDTTICIGDSTSLAASQSQGIVYRNVLNFDGSNDYGQISRTIENDFSIEYWVKTTQTGGGGSGSQWWVGSGIVDAEVSGVTNDFGTSLVGNKLCFGTGSPDISIQSTTAINDGQWHHVAVTREQSIGRLKIYIDGNLETTSTGASSASLSVPTNIKLGILQKGTNMLLGSIADLRIWNTVRSASEIASNKNTQLNGTEVGLLEYYPLLEGSGTSSADLAGNNQTLTLYNGVGWSNEMLYIGNSLYNYTWSTGDTTETINVSPSSTTAYTVTISDGISSCIDTITVTVNDPNFTFSNDTVLATCFADSVTVDAGTGWADYNWSTGETTQTKAFTATGTHTITVTDNGGCTSSDTVTVSVINPVLAQGDTMICINTSATVGYNALTNISFLWSNSNTSPSISVSPVVTSNYTVTISDGISSCIDTISITVNDPNFTFTNDTVLATCFADSVTVDAGTGWAGYNWSTGETTQTKAFTATGTHTITVTDNGGCTSSDTVTVSVINPVLAQGDTMICINTSATVGYIALTNISFLWSNSNTSPSISVSPVVNSNYSVEISDLAQSCYDTIAVFIDTLAPTAVPVSNLNVYLNNVGQATASATDANWATTDNCGLGSFSLSNTIFACSDLGSNTVMFYATDNNNNIDSASMTITVIDTVSPIVATQNITIYLDANGAASIAANDIDNGSADNCSIASMAVSPNTFTCADSNSNTVILTVTDGSGNVSTGTAVVTVLDTISPIALAQNITIYLDANGNTSITGADVNNGSSDNCAIATMTVSPNTFTCADSNANAVTFTVTDVSGNSSTASATVTVLDTFSPTVITQNISVNLDANGSVSILASDVNNGSTDNCGIASISVLPNTFTCADSNANTVILTVTDISGNSASAAATVTITDIIAPTVTAQNITAYLDANGSVSISATQVDNGSTDNCAIASMSVSPNTFTCADSNSNTVTLTVTDISGNSNTATAIVNVVDTISPTVITQNVSVYLDASGNASITTADVNNGSSDNCAIANLSVFPSTFSCANLSGDTVALTATDVSGNSATSFAIVTVIDTINPQVSAQNITVYLAGLGVATLLPSDVDNGSTDNCAITNYSVSPNNFSCADTGLNVVTLTVTDASGNSASTIANVIILDTLLPNVVAQNATVYLDSAGQVVITTATVDGGSSSSCSLSSFTVSPDTFTCADTGNNVVTLTMVSGSGVTSSATATVTVLDTIAPMVSTQNILVYLDASGNATISVTDIDSGSSDNCAIATMAVLPNTFSCADTGANSVTLTITDVSGNVNSETAIVTVLDTITPVAIAQDINLYLDLNGSATLQASDIDNGSYDNCSIASMSVSADSFTCAEIGSNTVTLTVIDQNGLSATANALVTVVDTITPTLSAQNVSVYLDLVGTASINLSDIDNGSFDNCSIASISLSDSLFDCENVGANSIYLIGIDASGNMDSSLAIVTVLDTIRPQVTAEDYQVYLDEEGLATVTTTDVNAVSNDNCAIDTTYLAQTNFTCADIGIKSILVFTRDASGNLDSMAINIEVLDTIAPVIIACPENIDACESLVEYDLPEAIDNCAQFETTLTKGLESGSSFELGTTEIQYAFSDSSGNVSYCSFTVTVNSLPTLEVTSDTTISSGESIELSAVSDAEVIFDWTPSNYLDDPTISNPISTPVESITYTVFATSDKGCVQQDSVRITVEETLREITIYNAFSPNNDGKNDFLEILGLEFYSESKVLIVNRYGAKVFESEGYDNPWDGTYNGNDLPIGPYFYFIETGVEGAETLTGEISLIR
jgi:gliding motility-associated-like protein